MLIALALVLSSTVSQTASDPAPVASSQVIGPAVRFGDYDGDGLLDAYVVNPTSGDRLLRNVGDGTFADVTREAGLAGILGSRMALWQDYDRDGALDLFVCSSQGRSRLMRNLGGGSFADVTRLTGIAQIAQSHLFAEWIDYDADGFADLHLVTERGDELYHNCRGESLEATQLPRAGTSVTSVVVPPDALVSHAGGGGVGSDVPVDPLPSDRGGSRGRSGADAAPGGSGSSSLTGSVSPMSGSGQVALPAYACSDSIDDQATSGCISASSTPALGMLYPLSSNLFVGPTGRVGLGTTSPNAGLHVTGVDGLLATGTFGSGTLPATGAGTRMMWYPRKSAFRAGTVSGAQWDDANIGDKSTAMGVDTNASGSQSTAMGNSTTASGFRSTAMGDFTAASGNRSTAIGHETTASGFASTAMGSFTDASADLSTAMGTNTNAIGSESTAMGSFTTASAPSSTAMGSFTTASASFSTSMGTDTDAESYASVALGRHNVGGGTPNSWVSTDPLFEIGNGTSSAARSNAMTVLKSGSVGIGAVLPANPLQVDGSGTAAGGVAGVSEVVAHFRQSTSNQHGAVSIDASLGRDSVLYLAENGAAVWDLRNDSSASDDFNIRYQGGGGNATVLTIETSGDVGIGRSPTGNRLEVEGTASKTTMGNWLANSDRRIKTDVRTVERALDTLDRVRPVVFRYNDKYRAAHPSIEDKDYYNVIAQEFAEVFPEYVKPSGEGDILQVDTYPMQVCAVAAVQELHARMRERDRQMREHDEHIAALEARLQAQADQIASLKSLTSRLAAAIECGNALAPAKR